MKLVNRTKWDTRDLAALARETFKRYPMEAKRYLVEINPRRRPRIGGYAWLGVRRIIMKVPNPALLKKMAEEYERLGSNFHPSKDFGSHDFAYTLTHEIGHTINLDHKDMSDKAEYGQSEWAKNFAVRPKRDKPKEKVDVRAVRYGRVLALINEKESRLKRLQNSLKKLRRKRRYYERHFVPATGTKPESGL